MNKEHLQAHILFLHNAMKKVKARNPRTKSWNDALQLAINDAINRGDNVLSEITPTFNDVVKEL